MAQTHGWFPDPYGRFQQRYHDGERWTAHVANGDAQQVDPMGASAVIPFVQPQSTLSGTASPPSAPSAQRGFAAPEGTAAGASAADAGVADASAAEGASAAGPGTADASVAAGESAAGAGAAGASVAGSGGGVAGSGGGVAGSGGGGDGLWRFLDSLGPQARKREAPSLHTALAGAGGAIAAVGIVALINGNSDNRALAAVAGIVLIGTGLAIRLLLPVTHRELRAAAVGIGVVGIIAMGVAIVGDDLDGAAGYLVVAVLFLAAWVLPGFRGRPIMLGLGALSLVFALGSATSSSRSRSVGSVDLGRLGDYQGSLFLVCAGVLLGLVYLLDRVGFHGVATSLVAAALISALVGVASTVSKLDDTGGTLLIVLVGIVVCAVGSHGRRRATTWYGAAVASVGVIAFWIAATTPSSTRSVAAVVLVAGVILIAVPLVITAVVNARSNGASGTGTPTGTGEPPQQLLAPPTVQ